MSKPAITKQMPWKNRWQQPSIEQLLEPQKEQNLKIIPQLLERISEFPGVEQKLVWYGVGWKWTWQFDLPEVPSKNGDLRDILAFVVPDPEQLIVCVPLYDDLIESMPVKRLNRFIREQIKSAKFAVHVHWAMFTPSNQPEVDHVLDLIKRKHKFLTAANK